MNERPPFNPGLFSTQNNEEIISLDNLRYSINLMWINTKKDENGESICCVNNKYENIEVILEQLKKWGMANPEAEINLWYDSQHTNINAIENTQKKLLEISTEHPSIKFKLRDIRDIPFIHDNFDHFQETIPLYFRIDFSKLIICLHVMENEGMDSAIFSDISIGQEVEELLSKQKLYNSDSLENLIKYGMLIGSDHMNQPENQFLQMLNTPELISSLKHAINSCLYIATNALNLKNINVLRVLHSAPFMTTMMHIYVYLLVLQSKQPVKIRADVVKEGNQDQWVTYEPEKHSYIMFGNSLKPFTSGSFYLQNNEFTPLSDIVKLPEKLGLSANEEEFSDLLGNIPDLKNAVRKDLNPGKMASEHYWRGNAPHPTQGDEFHCTFWPQERIEKTHTHGNLK